MNKKNMVLNSIKTPDGTILISKQSRDYQEHLDANGEIYFIGEDRVGTIGSLNRVSAVDLCIFDDDDHKNIRQGFYWGTYGRDGVQPVQYLPLKDLETDHIEAIINTQKQLPTWRINIFKNELNFRKDWL